MENISKQKLLDLTEGGKNMSEQKLLNLTNDYIFKRTFGYTGSGNITKILLRDILQDNISEVQLDNQTITEKELMDDKVGIMDIRAVLNRNTECDIEMQVVNQHNIEKRILFYLAKMYTKSIKEGNNYNNLKKSICVLFADFKLDGLHEVEKYITKWNIREEEYKNIILTDVLELVIIELPKYFKYRKKEKRENLNLWLKFLKNPEVSIMVNENDSQEIKETKRAINKAQAKLEEISRNEHERYLAELREKYIRDQVAVQEYGYIKGREEGKAEGIEEGRKEGMEEGRKKGELNSKKAIAQKLLTDGMDAETVAKITELTLDEVKSIDNEKIPKKSS